MIAALKQAIAIYPEDPEWERVRPPLVELTSGQAKYSQRNSAPSVSNDAVVSCVPS